MKSLLLISSLGLCALLACTGKPFTHDSRDAGAPGGGTSGVSGSLGGMGGEAIEAPSQDAGGSDVPSGGAVSDHDAASDDPPPEGGVGGIASPEADAGDAAAGAEADGGGVLPDADASAPTPSEKDAGDDDDESSYASCEELSCDRLASALRNRYSFNGTGTTVVDSVGQKDGQVHGAALSGEGQLELDGHEAYVQLPLGVANPAPDVTYEAWFSWRGGEPLQRLFDFGRPTLGGDEDSTLYLALSGMEGDEGREQATAGFSPFGGVRGRTVLQSNWKVPTSGTLHVALVVTRSQMILFADGNRVGEVSALINLGLFPNTSNYLGRSTTESEPFFNGVLEEFRIYALPLNESDIETSQALGPDVVFP